MGAFILYMTKVSVCLILFSILFRLMMMKETFFRFNRITLLAGIVVCSVLPLFQVYTTQTMALQRPVSHLEKILILYETSETFLPESVRGEEVVSNNREGNNIPSGTAAVTEKRSFPLFKLLFIVYVLGVLVMLFRLAITTVRLRQLISKNRHLEKEGYKLIVTEEDIVPFSFFNSIVISEKDYRENPDEIILHERMHLERKHSWDVIFTELFLVFHWFNPAVWLLNRDLREIHEYEVDNAVLSHGIDAQEYQLLLLRKAVGEKRYSALASNFNHSKIKNRILMMLRHESAFYSKLKSVVLLFLFAGLLLAFSKPHSEKEASAATSTPTENRSSRNLLGMVLEKYHQGSIVVLVDSTQNLLFMTKSPNAASIEIANLHSVESSSRKLANIIENESFENDLQAVNVVLIASETTYMRTINSVREMILASYSSAIQRMADDTLPLTIKYAVYSDRSEEELDIAEKLMMVVE